MNVRVINIIVKLNNDFGERTGFVYNNITITMACITLDQTLEQIYQFKNLNTVFNNVLSISMLDVDFRNSQLCCAVLMSGTSQFD